jgi:hypothetical protein
MKRGFRERALEIARKLDWDRLVKENPPPQSWFDGDEPKPFVGTA